MLTETKQLFLKYVSEYTETELANKLNVSPRTIRRYAREFDIKPKPNKYQNRSIDEWIQEFNTHYSGYISIQGHPYRNKDGHITATCVCNKCGTTWTTVLTHKLNQNTGCIHCDKGNHGNKFTWQEVEQRLNAQPYGQWKLIKYGNYSKKNSVIKCCRCGQQRTVKLSDIIATTTLRCPNCQTGSFGEYVIANVLRYNKIPFEREYSIRDKQKHYRIDFVINDRIVIEYSGEQHFQTGFMYNKQISDGVRQKEQWSKNNNLQFVEIKGNHRETMDHIIHKLEEILQQPLYKPTPEFFMQTDPDMQTVLSYMKTHSARQTMKDLNIPSTKIKRYIYLSGYPSISSWQLDNAQL